jgi:hypothetical protein
VFVISLFLALWNTIAIAVYSKSMGQKGKSERGIQIVLLMWNFILSLLSTTMIIASIWTLNRIINQLNKRNLLGKNKRERFKLNLTATLLHITVLLIAILTSFFQIVYVIAGYDSDYANEWETRLGTVDIILEAFISLIVCYVCWFLTHEPSKKDNKQDVSESVHLIPDETTEDHENESNDSFRAKMNRDSRMLYEDVPETPPTLKDRHASQATMGFMRADSVFYQRITAQFV